MVKHDKKEAKDRQINSKRQGLKIPDKQELKEVFHGKAEKLPRPKITKAKTKLKLSIETRISKTKKQELKVPKNVKKKPVKKIEKIEKEIKWTPEMSVNETTIDKQHQNLLAQINRLVKKISFGEEIAVVKETLHFLHTYIKEHLSYEEKYIKTIAYPGFNKHKKIHEGFVKFFYNYIKKFESAYLVKIKKREKLKQLCDEAKKFLGQWWVNHISTIDKEYAEYAKQKRSKPQEIELKTPSEKPKSKIKIPNKKSEDSESGFDMSKIKTEIENKLKKGKIEKHQAQILEQRAPATHVLKLKGKKGEISKKFILTGIPGFDELFEKGVPKGSAILIAGGAGSGKTIFCSQLLTKHASQGEKCFYMSFEESEKRLIQHMKDFGWDAEKYIKKGNLNIKRYSPFEITRNVDAMLAKEKGELLIDIGPVILPKDLKPDIIVLDSLTSIASAFTGKEDSYRVYIEQLFRFFEKLGSTSFLITETKQIPEIFSTTGVEEFLADGVIVFYNIKHKDVRENAIEVLKMRGEKHQKKIVAMTIGDNGITVYPEQEVFGEISEEK